MLAAGVPTPGRRASGGRARRRRPLAYALAAVALGAATLAAGALVMGGRLAEPVRRPAGEPPDDLPVRAVETPSGSGGIVRGWLHVPEDPRGAVLLLHGIRDSRHRMLGRARFLAGAGFAVLLVDLAAHGESDGEAITFGDREAHDVVAWLDLLRRELSGVPLAVVGASLGGVAALLAPQPLGVDALVLESVYPDVRTAVDNRLRQRFGALGPMLTPLLTVQLGPRLGVDADALRPIDAIGRVDAPVLLIAGERDRHTTPEDSRALLDAAREPKESWTVTGAAHVDFHLADPAGYEQRVLRFLETHLASDSD